MDESVNISTLPPHKLFRAWCYAYLGRYFKVKLGPLHDKWFKLTERKRVGISAPRGFAKSHFWTFYYPLFVALTQPGKNIVIVSASATLAESFLMKIKKELEFNSLLRGDFGDQVSQTWRNNLLHFNNGSTIEAIGAQGRIRGKRPDLIVIDDLENDINVMSEELRRKLVQWFTKAVINTLTVDGQLIIVGTKLHPLSFLARLVAKDESVIHNYSKWHIEQFNALDDFGESVWPQLYTTSWLKDKEAEIGIEAFQQEYMNNPIPDEYRQFKPEYFKYFTELPDDLVYTTTVDPAAKIEERHDYTAIVTVGMNKKGEMYIVEVTRAKLLPNEIIDEILHHYKRWNSHTIGFEEVAFQTILRRYFDMECAKKRLFPYVQELKLDVSKHGRRKRYRIEALQPYFKAGMIHMREDMKDLQAELLGFPSGQHDDVIDALASQLELVRPGSPKSSEVLLPGTFGHHWAGIKAAKIKGKYNKRRWHKG